MVKKLWFRKPSCETSKRMKLVKSSGTSIERVMAMLLDREGIKFDSHPFVPGKPDFVIKNMKIAIFCDSSFWHGRRLRDIHGEAFKKNKPFWINKLESNKRRDARVSRLLRSKGWSVLRFWDTDILRKPSKVHKKLLRGITKNVERKNS